MQPLYVSKLFELLKFLGIEQRAVAQALGVSKTQVSLWAHGKRAIPKAHAEPFIQFIWRAISDALERAMDAKRGPGESSRDVFDRADAMDPQQGQAMLQAWLAEDTRQQAKLPLSRELNSLLHVWAMEIMSTKGELAQAIHTCIRNLMPYARQDPMKWSREERQRAHETSLELARYFRYLEQLLDRPEEREWARPPGPEMHPIAYLNNLAGWAGMSSQANAEVNREA